MFSELVVGTPSHPEVGFFFAQSLPRDDGSPLLVADFAPAEALRYCIGLCGSLASFAWRYDDSSR